MMDKDRIAALEAKVAELEKTIEEVRASIAQEIKRAFDDAGRSIKRQVERSLDL